MSILLDKSKFVVSSVKNLQIPSPSQQMASAVVTLHPELEPFTVDNYYEYIIDVSTDHKLGYVQSVRVNNPTACKISFLSNKIFTYIQPFSERVFNINSNSEAKYIVYVDKLNMPGPVVLELRNYPEVAPIESLNQSVANYGYVAGRVATVQGNYALHGVEFGLASSIAGSATLSVPPTPGVSRPTVYGWECDVVFSSSTPGNIFSIAVSSTLFTPVPNSTQRELGVSQKLNFLATDSAGVATPTIWYPRTTHKTIRVPFGLYTYITAIAPVVEYYKLDISWDATDWTTLTLIDLNIAVDIR
jgi:hypothetical protein